MSSFFKFNICNFSILSLAIFLSGCGEKITLTKVTGTVKLKGTDKPLEYVVVEFWPDDGPTSRGKTDASGNFTLRTMDEADAEGAVLGSHKITFKDTWPMKDDVLTESGEWQDNSKGKKSRISTKYADPSKSPETVSVTENQAPLEFELDPAGR
jgi:hypothetical protein